MSRVKTPLNVNLTMADASVSFYPFLAGSPSLTSLLLFLQSRVSKLRTDPFATPVSLLLIFANQDSLDPTYNALLVLRYWLTLC